MPIHTETRNCKGCGDAFEQLIKKGRPFQKCAKCRAKKEKASTI